ncbi:hypothetical protein KC332_g1016 [Hortaea werneckii]|nr:hypothetical protein KC358_g4414 [Hortaea werneckii]KAI6851605.1 hypothetical protein KC350_g1578 [Hortaea werneckii]KAI6929496.1 hypothetical protein KC348_g7846 [Hortaea werneckii]KAI6943994.1 hypothetical protein KC341_g1109 [Hortaea werneckii]KAI6982506.1 hypothetical protein KC321_g618 [Hortaea werneckii]
MSWNAVNYAPGYKPLDASTPVVPKKHGKKHTPRKNTNDEVKLPTGASQRDALDDGPGKDHYRSSGDDEKEASSTPLTTMEDVDEQTPLTLTDLWQMHRYMPSQDDTDALSLDVELAQEIFNQLLNLCIVNGEPDEDAAENVGQGVTYVINGWNELDKKHNTTSKTYCIVANPFEAGKTASTGVSEKFIAVGREAARALSNALTRSKANTAYGMDWSEADVLKKLSGSLRFGMEKYHLALAQSSKPSKQEDLHPSDRVPKKELRTTEVGKKTRSDKEKTSVLPKLPAIKLSAPTATEIANCGADERATLLMFEKLETIFLNDGEDSKEAAMAICMGIDAVFVPWDKLKEEDIDAHINALPQAWSKSSRKTEGDGDSDTSRMMNSVLQAVERIRLSDGQDIKPEVYTRELLGVKLSMEKLYAQLRDWLEPLAQTVGQEPEVLTQMQTASRASTASSKAKRPLEEAAVAPHTTEKSTKRAKIDTEEVVAGKSIKSRAKRGRAAPQWTPEECLALLQLWDNTEFPFWSPGDRTKIFNSWSESKQLKDVRTWDAMEQRIKSLITTNENNAEGLIEATQTDKESNAIDWSHYAQLAGATRKNRPSPSGLEQAIRSMNSKHVKSNEEAAKNE